MGLKTQISDDIKTAMKAQDKDRLQVLRMVLSELKYAQAQSGNVHTDLPLEEEQRIVSSYHKKLEKAVADYPGEAEKQKLRAEMAVVEAYMPKRASEVEIRKAAEDLLANTSEKQFGVLMKQLMGSFGSAADGKLISAVLKELLGTK